MALNKNTVSLPFALGLDEKSSEDTAQPGSLESSSNAVFDKSGQIQKRNGFKTPNTIASKTANYTLDAGVRIDEFNKELLIADGTRVCNITEPDNVNRATVVGTLHNINFAKEDAHSVSLNNVANVKHLPFEPVSEHFVDIFVMTQGSNTSCTLDLIVRDRETGSLVQTLGLNGGAAATFSSSGANNFTPSLHMVKVGTTVFIVFNRYNTTNSPIVYQRLSYDSGTDTFSVTGPQFLRNSSGTNLATDVDFSALGVTGSNNQLYVAFYEPGSANTVDSAKVERFALSDLTGSGAANATGTALTLFTAFSGTGLDRNIAREALKVSPGFLCKFYSGDPGSETLIAGCTIGTLSSKSTGITIFSAEPDFSATSSDAIADPSNLKRVLICGTQAPLTLDGSAHASQVDKRKLILTSALGNPGNGRPRSRTSSRFPLKSMANSTLSGAPLTTSGFLNITPTAASDMLDSSARVYFFVTSGTTLNVTVIEGGTMFQTGGAEATNVQNQLAAAINVDPAGGSPGTVTLSSPGALAFDDTATTAVLENSCYQYETQIFDAVLSSGTLTVSTSGQKFPNASVITDAVLARPLNLYGESYTGAMPDPMYFAMTYNGGSAKTDNGYDCLMAWTPFSNFTGNFEPVAYLPSGKQSANPALDFEEKNGTGGGRLFTGVTNLEITSDVKTGQPINETFAEASYGTASVLLDGYNVTKSQLNFFPDRVMPGLSAGTQMLYGGGALFSYDGDEIVENGFYSFPAVKQVKAVPTGDGLFPTNGSYSYIFTFEFIDAKGNIHRSPTSPAVELTVQTTNIVQALIYNDQATRKFGRFRVVAYRANPGSVVFRKVKTISFLTTSFTSRYILFEDSGGSQLEYADNEALYTTGGVLENQQPGSITDMVLHKNRIVVSAASEFVRFSKPLTPFTSPGFPAPQFIIDIPGDIRNITGVESGINFFTIFTRDNVFAVYGDGPNAIGQGGFTLPAAIAEGQGLAVGGTHLNHAFGIFYMADRGLYLINPNGQVQYVGAQVEDTLGNAHRVFNILLFDYTNELRILYSDNTSTKFRCATYNTFFKQWSDWEITARDKPVFQTQRTNVQPHVSHFVLAKNGTLSKQVATFQDQTSAFHDVELRVTLNKLYMAGLQQAQRVYRAMLLYDLDVGGGVASLQMKFAFDNDATFTETHTLNPLPADPEQVRVHLSQQKCRAVKVQLIVQHGASSTQGAKLNGIAFEVGARPTTFKLPAANTF